MEQGYVAVAGEALIDLVPQPGPDLYRAVPGGSPANVAVGLSRLGVATQLVARLSGSGFGQRLRSHLSENRVGLALAVGTDDPATLAVVTLDERGSATYDFYADGTADFGWRPEELPQRLPDGAVALCTGSIAVFREPGAAALTGLVRTEREHGGATIVVDPNLRPSLIGDREQVRSAWGRLLPLADVVKVSDEDLAWLHPGDDPAEVAADWAAAGPALVVLTRGGEGALAITAEDVVAQVPAEPIGVVDTVGAGDSFTSGLVDTLRQRGLLGRERRDALAGIDTDALSAVLARAARVAGLTCGREGADPPTAVEVDRTVPT